MLGLVQVMQEDLLTLSERWESGGGKKMSEWLQVSGKCVQAENNSLKEAYEASISAGG